MKPVKPLLISQSKGGRGPVVLHFGGRGLNTYTSVNMRMGRSYNTCVTLENSLLNRTPGLDEITRLKNRNTKNPNYINKQLFRILRFDDTWVSVYQKLSTSDGSLTPGVDGNTIDGTSPSKLRGIKVEVLSGKFE